MKKLEEREVPQSWQCTRQGGVWVGLRPSGGVGLAGLGEVAFERCFWSGGVVGLVGWSGVRAVIGRVRVR